MGWPLHQTIKFTLSLRGTDVFHLLLSKILYDVSLKLDCNGIEKQRALAVPSSSCSGKLHPVCSKTAAYTHGFVWPVYRREMLGPLLHLSPSTGILLDELCLQTLLPPIPYVAVHHLQTAKLAQKLSEKNLGKWVEWGERSRNFAYLTEAS